MMAAKVAAYGMVGGVSAVANGGRFESGFLSSGFSQAAGQYMNSRDIGLPDNPQGWDSASNAAVVAVIGRIASKLSGVTFEQGALTFATSRLFNDIVHKRDPGSEVAQVWDDGISSKNTVGQCIPFASGSTYLGVANVPGDGLRPDYTIENAFAIGSAATVGVRLGLALRSVAIYLAVGAEEFVSFMAPREFSLAPNG
jgi:hypothetical protein